MNPPRPFTPVLPARMAAALDRAVQIHRDLMRRHNSPRGGPVHRDVLEDLDALRRDLELLGDRVGRHAANPETGRAIAALAEAAAALDQSYTAALGIRGNERTAAPGIRGHERTAA